MDSCPSSHSIRYRAGASRRTSRTVPVRGARSVDSDSAATRSPTWKTMAPPWCIAHRTGAMWDNRQPRGSSSMGSSASRRILVVANRTAATPALIDEVQRRASEAMCRFTVLVPRTFWDADTEESAITLELAIPLLEEASGGHVNGLIGDSDPFEAVSAALANENYDEVILSTLPTRVSRWLHLDLPARLQRLWLAVTVITAKAGRRHTAAG